VIIILFILQFSPFFGKTSMANWYKSSRRQCTQSKLLFS
jgi:hypothetical protein